MVKMSPFLDPKDMTRVTEERALEPLRESVTQALRYLEQIAVRSSDASSRALAQGAAGDLRAKVPASWLA